MASEQQSWVRFPAFPNWRLSHIKKRSPGAYWGLCSSAGIGGDYNKTEHKQCIEHGEAGMGSWLPVAVYDQRASTQEDWEHVEVLNFWWWCRDYNHQRLHWTEIIIKKILFSGANHPKWYWKKEHGGEREKILDSVKVTLYDVTLPSIERLEERTAVPPPLLTNFSRRSCSSSTFL